MKSILISIIILLISFLVKQENKIVENNINPILQNPIENENGLFKLEIKRMENFVRIIAPKNSGFELPDSSAKTEIYKFGDFNADKKEDVLVHLGACGTGGCMYGLFLKQFDNYYKLGFMDYLKNAEFKIGKNGLWTITSSEEIEAYNPSKLQITEFKFDKTKYKYEVDTTYVYIDIENEKMMNDLKKTNR